MTPIAARAGLLPCHSCGFIHAPGAPGHGFECTRCGAALHARKPDSVARTWAFLIAAYLLYIPANVLPVMETGSLFGAQQDTIMSGVVFLWTSGSWLVAAVIFFVSIVVPVGKLIILTYLVVSVQRGSQRAPRARTRLYRLIELVGRWSMADIYVAAVLVALVQFKTLATVYAGPGAIAFGAVVVLTMLASMSFDPRLIWDPLEEHNG